METHFSKEQLKDEIYYFKDNTSKERYIAATIWNPGMREN